MGPSLIYLVAAFAWRTAYLTLEALRHRNDFYRLSKAHLRYLVVKNFYRALRSPSTMHELDQERWK